MTQTQQPPYTHQQANMPPITHQQIVSPQPIEQRQIRELHFAISESGEAKTPQLAILYHVPSTVQQCGGG